LPNIGGVRVYQHGDDQAFEQGGALVGRFDADFDMAFGDSQGDDLGGAMGVPFLGDRFDVPADGAERTVNAHGDFGTHASFAEMAKNFGFFFGEAFCVDYACDEFHSFGDLTNIHDSYTVLKWRRRRLVRSFPARCYGFPFQ
jgi:hypothetical protein